MNEWYKYDYSLKDTYSRKLSILIMSLQYKLNTLFIPLQILFKLFLASGFNSNYNHLQEIILLYSWTHDKLPKGKISYEITQELSDNENENISLGMKNHNKDYSITLILIKSIQSFSFNKAIISMIEIWHFIIHSFHYI